MEIKLEKIMLSIGEQKLEMTIEEAGKLHAELSKIKFPFPQISGFPNVLGGSYCGTGFVNAIPALNG